MQIFNISVPLWSLAIALLMLIAAIIGLIIQNQQLSLAKSQAKDSKKHNEFQRLIKREDDFKAAFSVYMNVHAKTDPKVLTVESIVGDCKASVKKFNGRNINLELIPELEEFIKRGEEITSEKRKYH